MVYQELIERMEDYSATDALKRYLKQIAELKY